MKSSLVFLLVVGVTVVYAQNRPNIHKSTVKTQLVPKYSPKADRKRSQIFPKTLKKFVVTQSPMKNDILSTTDITIKRPVMKKIMPLYKTPTQTTFKYEPVTRRPLMKSIKFTIKPPLAERRIESTPDKVNHPVRNSNHNKTVYKHKDITTETYIKKDTVRRNFMLPTRPPLLMKPEANFYKFTSLPIKNGEDIQSQKIYGNDKESSIKEKLNNEEAVIHNNNEKGTIQKNYSDEKNHESSEGEVLSDEEYDTTESDISLEDDWLSWDETNKFIVADSDKNASEDDDRNEFIFVNKPMIGLRNKDKDWLQDETRRFNKEPLRGSHSRKTRSVNIIEEENLGTTISGFKFTGRQTELSHDLGFRNIHS